MNTNTISGNVVSFSTPRSEGITSCKVYFSPKQSGSGTPSIENIRGISGLNEVTVEQRAKNLWNEKWELGTFNTTTGIEASSSS